MTITKEKIAELRERWQRMILRQKTLQQSDTDLKDLLYVYQKFPVLLDTIPELLDEIERLRGWIEKRMTWDDETRERIARGGKP